MHPRSTQRNERLRSRRANGCAREVPAARAQAHSRARDEEPRGGPLAHGDARRQRDRPRFLALLPLSLTLTDYNSTEKVADLPISIQDAPPGIDPDVGDIAYYAPWGNLAIFYRDFGYSTVLVKLGRLDSGAEALSGRGPLRVTITRAERVHGS